MYHEQRRVECMYNLITLKFIFPHVQAPTNATICAIYLTNLCFLLIWMHKHEKKQKKNIHERVSTFQIRVPVKSKRNETESNQTKSKIKPNQRKETKHRNERRPTFSLIFLVFTYRVFFLSCLIFRYYISNLLDFLVFFHTEYLIINDKSKFSPS